MIKGLEDLNLNLRIAFICLFTYVIIAQFPLSINKKGKE